MHIKNYNFVDKYINKLSPNEITIFLFHGVIKTNNNEIRNYTNKHLNYDFFCELLTKLAQVGNCLSMDQILYHFETKEKPPKNSFAITFDDGFENNVSIAGPVLNDLNMNCTIYLTTNFVDKNIMSWIDRIEYVVEHNHNFIVNEKWLEKPLKIKNKHEKISLLNKIRDYVKSSKQLNFDDFSDNFCNKFTFSKNSSDEPLDKKLNWNEIKYLKNSDTFLFGGHSHSHPILSYLSLNKLKFELDESLGLLKKRGEIQTVHYSYPEGLSYCFNQKVINELKKRDIKCCPTAIDGTNSINTDPFHLRRIFVI